MIFTFSFFEGFFRGIIESSELTGHYVTLVKKPFYSLISLHYSNFVSEDVFKYCIAKEDEYGVLLTTKNQITILKMDSNTDFNKGRITIYIKNGSLFYKDGLTEVNLTELSSLEKLHVSGPEEAHNLVKAYTGMLNIFRNFFWREEGE